MTDWSVRDESAARQTGFGSEQGIARSTFEALVRKATESGEGGEFVLLADGTEIARAFVPKRKGAP